MYPIEFLKNMDLTSPIDDERSDEEMPLFGWGSKKVDATASPAKEINYKSKTEHKLLLAKQDPEPVFDLTDCNLHEVPTGTYSWCKVCRKEVLLMQNNQLKSLVNAGSNFGDLTLLRVLDVHNNRLSKLPDCIGELANLQALYLHFNELKHLPDSLKQLKALQVLNIKGNRFKEEVPSIVGHLHSLRKLDVSANVVKRLPNSLANLKSLTDLVLDEENYLYPPRDVCIDGLNAIMTFLCKGSGKDYSSPDTSAAESAFNLEPNLVYTTGEDSWTKVALTQDRHQAAHQEAETSLQALFDNLAQVALATQLAKSKFLEELIHDKDRMTEELCVAQNKKDGDRQRLLADLYEVEQESMEALKELLQMNELRRNDETMLEAIERERRDFDAAFTSAQSGNVVLRRKEVLEAMESILENQFLEAKMNSASALNKREHIERTKLENLDLDRRLHELMSRSDRDQENLMAEIAREEAIQKVAFGAFLMKRDDDYLQLTQQILLIEQELANLTLLEVSKSQLRVQFEKNVMQEQREVLTRLLVQLMEQQDGRHRELQKRLDEIEERRTVEENDFWLLQYQRLMDVKPDQIKDQVKLMDDQVKVILKKVGAEDQVPRFARNGVFTLAKLRTLGHDRLKTIGIKDVFMREDIMREASLPDEAEGAHSVQPSAPPLMEERQPSLRTRFETECVICLDRKCTLLFLNCGHVCCCEECGPALSMCPLCRSLVVRAIQLRFA